MHGSDPLTDTQGMGTYSEGKIERSSLPRVRKKRKMLFILIDGLGDVSVPQFDYRTPLQQAKTPFMDYLAAAGRNGLLDPVQVGLACGSDTAHLSIFGYPPKQYVNFLLCDEDDPLFALRYYRGRGALETIGTGLEMRPGDIAFKVIIEYDRYEMTLILCSLFFRPSIQKRTSSFDEGLTQTLATSALCFA